MVEQTAKTPIDMNYELQLIEVTLSFTGMYSEEKRCKDQRADIYWNSIKGSTIYAQHMMQEIINFHPQGSPERSVPQRKLNVGFVACAFY